MQSSSVYARLGEAQGLSDHQAVLTLMLSKIATNLKVYGGSEQLVHLTLALFRVSVGVRRHKLGG
jgi:exportin-7